MSMFGPMRTACARTMDVRVPGNQHEAHRGWRALYCKIHPSNSTNATVCRFGHELQAWAKWSVRIPHGREARHRDHECCRAPQKMRLIIRYMLISWAERLLEQNNMTGLRREEMGESMKAIMQMTRVRPRPIAI